MVEIIDKKNIYTYKRELDGIYIEKNGVHEYTITLSPKLYCNCVGYMYRGKCKHIEMVEKYAEDLKPEIESINCPVSSEDLRKMKEFLEEQSVFVFWVMKLKDEIKDFYTYEQLLEIFRQSKRNKLLPMII